MRTLAVISLTLLACSNPAQKTDCQDCQRGLVFSSGPALPSAIDHHATAIANNFLYVIGGNDYQKQYADVWFAPIRRDGTLGGWSNTTSLPAPRAGHGVAVIRDRLFVISGQSHGIFFASVLSAVIHPDGTLGSWEAEPNLPEARFHAYVAQSGDSIWVTGGVNEKFDATTSIYRARIVDDRLREFSSAGELPVARSHHVALVHNGHLLIAGGLTGNPTGESHNLKEILRADIGSDALSSFTTIGMLEDPPATLSGFEKDEAWILVGGLDDAGNYLADVRRIPLLGDGSLGKIESLGALPIGRSHVHQTPSAGDFLYSIGGSVGYQQLTNAVQIGHFEWLPKTAALPTKRALAFGPRRPHCPIK